MKSLPRKLTMVISASLLMTCILSTGGTSAAVADGTGQAQIKIGNMDTNYKLNDKITVPVNALNTTELMGLEFTVKYDPQVLHYVKAQSQVSGDFNKVDVPNAEDEQNGILKYVLLKKDLPPKDTIAEISIAALQFDAVKLADTTSVQIDNIIATTGYKKIDANTTDQKVLSIAGTGGPTPTPTPTPTPPPGSGSGGGVGGGGAQETDSVSQKIIAAAGGKVELGTKAKVVIPPNALKADATISIRSVVDAQSTSGILPAGMALKIGSVIYDFSTSGDSRFNKPVTITLTMDKQKIASGLKPAAYYYHEARKQWIYVGGQVNETTGEITFDINHFTKFAVFTDETLVQLSDTANHWASAYIDRLVGMKVINGYPDQTFKPENNVTRAEFSTMLVSALGLQSKGSAMLTFADAEQIPDWAKDKVRAAVESGIIEGRPGTDGTVNFDADALITRAEMAVMIQRALHTDASGQTSDFADDSDIPGWAKPGIVSLVGKGIISGFDDNTFRPADNATRAQAAAMIFKLLNEAGI